MQPSCNPAGIAGEPAWIMGCTLVTSVTHQMEILRCNDISHMLGIKERCDHGEARRLGAKFAARRIVNQSEEKSLTCGPVSS